MATATQGAKARAPRVPKPVYPRQQDNNDPLFWAAEFLRTAVEQDALMQAWEKLTKKAGFKSTPLTAGIWNAHYVLKDDNKLNAVRCRDRGLLLYVWPHTKVFDQVPT